MGWVELAGHRINAIGWWGSPSTLVISPAGRRGDWVKSRRGVPSWATSSALGIRDGGSESYGETHEAANYAFRPRGLGNLRNREPMLSMAGVSVPTGIPGISVTLPKQVPITSPTVQAAFAAFDESYIEAVDNVLLALQSERPGRPPRTTGRPSTRPSSSRWKPSPSSSSCPLGTTSTGSNQVVDAIVGTSSNSLESQLLALPTSSIGFITQLPTATTSSIQAVIPSDVNWPTLRTPLRNFEGEAASSNR